MLACLMVAGARYYYSRCHGVDACAAVDAESHEQIGLANLSRPSENARRARRQSSTSAKFLQSPDLNWRDLNSIIVQDDNFAGSGLTYINDDLPRDVFRNLACLLLALAVQSDRIFQTESVDDFEVKTWVRASPRLRMPNEFALFQDA
jgi:hypothetical protein